MNLFRLDASIRTEGSVSREVADSFEASWTSTHPYGAVIRRNVSAEPLLPQLWIAGATGQRTPAEQRTPEQVEAAAVAATLADELLSADAYLFASSLYNFSVPQTLKAWIDMVITDPRFAAGSGQPLAGRSGVLVVARGGAYGTGTPRDGWDHGTPWLRRILADVWGLDLRVVEAELTLAGVNPALAAFRDLADESLRSAHDTARRHGTEIAAAVPVG